MNLLKYLPEALSLKYGDVADIHGTEIVRWSHPSLPEPTLEEQELACREYLKVHVATSIKKLAGAKIVHMVPEWKQRNMIARAVQLVEKKGSRTPAEQSELDMHQAVWDKVAAIRLYSDSLEAQAIASEDPLSVDIESGWPE
jgi:hypothetical protein